MSAWASPSRPPGSARISPRFSQARGRITWKKPGLLVCAPPRTQRALLCSGRPAFDTGAGKGQAWAGTLMHIHRCSLNSLSLRRKGFVEERSAWAPIASPGRPFPPTGSLPDLCYARSFTPWFLGSAVLLLRLGRKWKREAGKTQGRQAGEKVFAESRQEKMVACVRKPVGFWRTTVFFCFF